MRVSVIVPTLNEAERIRRCLWSVRVQEPGAEVIVVDGGSTDGTPELARPHARVVAGPRGRGAQMNAGARRARGDALLFLHADTLLHPRALAGLRSALEAPETAGGTFTLRFDHDCAALRFYSLCTRLPFRCFHYGDQGIFVRRRVFGAMGGFRELPLMEDVDFLARLRREGRVALVPRPVTTSARRFVERGVVRQQLLNTALVAAYTVGVAPERLARWYAGARP